MWDEHFWQTWYSDLDHHIVPLLRSIHDHIEIGAPPVKTNDGWLLIYCYIRNYISSSKIFGIEAVLLDANDPKKVIGRSDIPLLFPERPYEMYGKIPNVIFPSGALVNNNNLGIYYGAADTSVCLATCRLDELLKELQPNKGKKIFKQKLAVKKFSGNPIITPILEHDWESLFTLNPAALMFRDGNVHILYRAQGKDGTSVIGYAMSRDGVHIDERLVDPVYVPREPFEVKKKPGFSGCEDPRLTQMGNTIYMCYTAFNGQDPPRVALTSISADDFCQKRWNWTKPILISPPNEWDKDAALFPEKINGRYAFFHRLQNSIWIDYVDTLNFSDNKFIRGEIILNPRADRWDNEKIGIGPPPIKTDAGWILIYHGITKEDSKYRQGAALLDLTNPSKVIGQLDYPLLEPESFYQKKGLRPGTVFVCGAVVKNDEIYLYYGAADQLVSVATVRIEDMLKELKAV
jgi:beta-1,2-mannobiose phosphorylase / 1,2-beta-oligomannan phosphorylase